MRERAHLDPDHHHQHQHRFLGLNGLFWGLRLLIARGGDARLACTLASVGPGDRVLDVGCGPGVAVRAAVRRGAEAIGVDPDSTMLRLAGLLPHRRSSYRIGTAERLPLSDSERTVALSISAAHHWSDIDQGLGELHRVLDAGGRLVVMERHVLRRGGPHDAGWTDLQAQTFAQSCRQSGFSSVAVQQHGSGRSGVLAVVASKP